MAKKAASAQPLSSVPAAEGRLFCPREGCSSSHSGWIVCAHPECPKNAGELVERVAKRAS